jgi:NADPH-dependent 2,4-dienoyl-CoA reductase/sulfur reductase-like enzyme/nitrite reductase/ring-hydroxylating ferredoxin subunit
MEERVAGTADLQDGHMRTVTVGGKKVLLAKLDGRFYAAAARCPHWGGSLPDGTLHDGHVICPLHAGAFELRSGDLLEPPPLDAIPTFPVRVVGTDVFVDRPDDAKDSRLMPMSHADAAADSRLFVIIGAAAAAAAAAETLRQESYEGRIVMVSSEDRWPYDRPKLSKDYVAGTVQAKWLPLRSPEFYAEYGIERLHARVTSLDERSRVITMQDGGTLEPDAVLIATGGTPRGLQVPGADLPDVFTLRSWSDCDALIAAAENAGRAVVIGMEVAAGLAQRGLEVTVVGHGAVPFESTLGEPVGTLIRSYHEDHGTRFAMGHSVVRFCGENRIETVELDDGNTLLADLIVVGVGVRPDTSFMEGVDIAADGGLPVDEHLSVAPGVWAAGDVALFTEARGHRRMRIEHWRLAEQHGRAPARAMLGGVQPFTGVPFFWTQQFEREIYYAGAGQGWDEMVVRGDLQAWDFTVFYTRESRPIAACGTRGSEIGAFIELMRAGKLPPVDRLSDGMGTGRLEA